MARLLLVTRSMALSLRLADAHDVTEHPADDDLGTLTPEPGIDLVVLDVNGPEIAVQTVTQLRARQVQTPVLIVSGYQPEWAGLLSMSMPGVAVVALPITRATLLEGIAALLAPASPAETEPAVLPAPPDTPVPETAAPAPAQPETAAPEPAQQPQALPSPAHPSHGRRFHIGRRAYSSPGADTEKGPADTSPRTPTTGPLPVMPTDDLVLEDGYDPFFASAPQSLHDLRPAAARPDLSLSDLVHQLIDRAGELYGVPDTAQVLADEIVERADADAAAVLIPDGAVWRVSGGVGLRPLERRLVLDSSHWLIAESALHGRALLIEDTDIVRQKLAGAPLAAWRHLMSLPVPDLRSTVVVARGTEAGPFTERDLAAVIDPIREASGLLERALDTRRLARQLAALRDVDERRGR